MFITGKKAAALAGSAMMLATCPIANAYATGTSNTSADLAGIDVVERQADSYTKVANVSGSFSFDQDTVTPPDDVFNIFGTVTAGICSKPSVEFNEPGDATYYINVGGTIKEAYSVSLDSLKQKDAKTTIMTCTCAMSSAVANARITGVPLEDVISLDDLDDEINTITVKDADGYGMSMPLSYAINKGGMLVYSIDGVDLSSRPDGPVQLWVPDTVAKYFTRQVTEIELTSQATEPTIQGADDQYRAKVGIVNRMDDGDLFAVGQDIEFDGYADDAGQAIAAVEFSMDGGETWTSCETQDADSSKWVYWHFTYTPEQEGTYKMDVRARTTDGTVSPLQSSTVFTVVGGGASNEVDA